MYNRVTSFIATMFRDFANDDIKRADLNVVMVTHGLTLRLVRDTWAMSVWGVKQHVALTPSNTLCVVAQFLMRWFQYTVSDFENSFNPPNAGFVVMERTGKHVRGRAPASLLSLSIGRLRTSSPTVLAQQQKDYFELPQWSREVVGFPKEHTQGSLWQVLQNTTDMSHVPEQFQSFLEPRSLTEQELEMESRKVDERRTNHAHEEIFS